MQRRHLRDVYASRYRIVQVVDVEVYDVEFLGTLEHLFNQKNVVAQKRSIKNCPVVGHVV